MFVDEDAFNNAKLAISIARKVGATIFLVPEDIVEVRPKMVRNSQWIHWISKPTDTALCRT